MTRKAAFGGLFGKRFSGISIRTARAKTELDVDPNISTLHRGNAYWMATLSRLVYRHVEGETRPNEVQILHELRAADQRFTKIKSYDKNGSQAMLVMHELFMAIVFRGTDELIDWLNNMKINNVELECGTFHAGFYSSFNEVWGDIERDYRELQAEQELPLFITGHSLGGAMATITAAHCLFNNYPFVSVYTFGQPRALLIDTVPNFNAACGDRYFRFQRHYDLVGYTPVAVAHFGHVGQCIYIDEKGDLHNDPGWWFKFLNAMDSALEKVGSGWVNNLIQNHRMRDYQAAARDWRIGEEWGF